MCLETDCERPILAKGLCSGHYQRQRLGYSARGPIRPKICDPFERLSTYVQVTGCCWYWIGAINDAGYGVAAAGNGRSKLAHLWVYELLIGPTPKGLDGDHLCRVHSCVNPDHIEFVPHLVNLMRGVGYYDGKKTHCKRGHDMRGPNRYINPTSGDSYCRVCGATKQREYTRRKGVKNDITN